jgi:hypothetical protein
MKRSHIRALILALNNRADVVASMHVLSQPVLGDDDHAFLAEVAPQLPAIELLRWLGRCEEGGPRARVIAQLALDAARAPRRFEAEVLGATLDFVTPDDWAELFGALGPAGDASLARRVLERTSGSSTYRAVIAVLQASAPTPGGGAVDPCLASAEALAMLGGEALASGGKQAAVSLARALFPVRNDERGCASALRRAVEAAPERGPMLLVIAGAGLLGKLDDPAALLPASAPFACEAAPGQERPGDAALRSLAAHRLGDPGRAWLAAQVEAAVERGAPLAHVLEELCEPARRDLFSRSASLRSRVAAASSLADAGALEELSRVLPWAITDEAVLTRELLPAIVGRASDEALAAAATARAAATMQGRECAFLLDWLERRGSPRKALFGLAVAAVERGASSLDLLAWLSQRLASRSAWEQHGGAVLSALLARKAHAELAELFAQSWSEASDGPRRLLREGEAEGPGEASGGATAAGFREAVHAAFAVALARHARAALQAGDEPSALRSLSAMACLDPPTRLNPVLHDMAMSSGASGAALELIEVNASLARRTGGREATLHGVVSAVHVIAGA